jgi:hypothetical protein
VFFFVVSVHSLAVAQGVMRKALGIKT